MRSKMFLCLAVCAFAVAGTSACVGMAVGAAAGTAVKVGKVPFKVGGAVVDVVRDDKKEPDDKEQDKDGD